MRISYVPKKFGQGSLDIIRMANVICAEYQAQGLDITLRQLYYQFVARGYIPNKQSEYKRLGSIVNDARLAGLIDWDYIVDRTRNIRSMSHWENPAEIIRAVSRQFRHDKWAEQPTIVEVWVEKDALVGVLDSVCPGLDVAYFSCRGYTSQSEIWGAAQRLGAYMERGQDVVVVHLGDHDPSGIDMTRDIQDRMLMFGCDVNVERIALNMDQVGQYNPPPSPAKITDSRAADYIERFHDPEIDDPGQARSWELDALEPSVLDALITEQITSRVDMSLWAQREEREASERVVLTALTDNFTDIRAYMGREGML